eukprot:CAMPEP_0172322172 /NCGR_PEP_ID=MMETSP1058-20130122/45177_1 /TAXON_ID=83371 /ORGANISM="Detonula confervacea, Strain CCMP 353" /LENGTH=743 /DNA_ID=CAMNT_0013037833 /DNA_START=13 /DNA_END=2247 /DNA_ORIENTATION=-
MAETAAPSAPKDPKVAGAENGTESSTAAIAAAVEGAQVENNPSVANNDNPDASGGGNESQPPPVANAPPDAAAGEAPDAAAGGNDAPPPLPNENNLTTYFTTLSTTLQRQNNGNNMIRSSIASLLWEGVAPIVAAGNESGGNVFLAFESSAPPAAAGDAIRAAAMSPNQAALYLYAVAQNIVALESAVLGSQSSPAMYATAAGAGAGGMMDGMGPSNLLMGNNSVGGGVTAKQVAEIVSAVSIAATFCNSRSIIAQSGILPALAHLIESTGTIPPPPSHYLMKQSKSVLHALTPFHPDFLQVSLLAGQYRYASTFLTSHPTSHTTLDFPYLRLDPTSYLRTHYYAGLVHVGCNDWNAALDSFHLCITMPCSSVSAISIAARKKSLLVQCLLLESEELDRNATATNSKSNVQTRIGGSGSGGAKSSKSVLETKVLDLPGAASAAVCKYMSASSNRVGGNGGGGGSAAASSSGSGSAPERAAGSETSEQPAGGGGRERSSRRRMRSANSNSSSDAAAGEWGPSVEGSKSKNHSHLGSYHDLVSTYISGNSSHYAKLLTEMMDLLHSDGNWGLAKQLEGRLLAYRSIRKVASVYSVVGVDILEKKMQDGSVGEFGKHGIEDVLMAMAATDAKDPLLANPFVARIDQSTGMVSFLDHDDDSSDDCDDEDWMEADLSRRLQSCIALAVRVRDLDIALSTSPKYQQHAMREMMMKGDRGASAAMKQGQQGGGSSVADIGHGPMDIGVDW